MQDDDLTSPTGDKQRTKGESENRKERFIRFVRLQMDESLEKQVRKLRRPKAAINLAFGNAGSLSQLADVVSVDCNDSLPFYYFSFSLPLSSGE